MPQDYNATMNLPATAFPMRAGLPKSEPGTLARWKADDRYAQVLAEREGRPSFLLHDGPPYANGNVHLGTALNKVLKDFIVRYKNMAGFRAYYVPGWDTHGLPIELKARAQAGPEQAAAADPLALRRLCREYALGQVARQRAQFERLGVMGDWEHPYLTLRPEFEARQIELFGELARKGYIYKGLKPVYHCPSCETALAEAELEYEEDPCYTVYVRFPVIDDKGLFADYISSGKPVSVVIWTTTAWTLPGNVAVCVGPELVYDLVDAGEEYLLVAHERAAAVMDAARAAEYKSVASFTGAQLERVRCAHPFLPRQSPVILGDYVTTDSGTGIVHIAPGHGREDYLVCQKYPELPILVPVDAHGRMTADAGAGLEGLTTQEAGKAIARLLEQSGRLLATQKIRHDYPHCWRCKKPVLSLATPQWFCSVEDFKADTVKAIEDVKWIPAWGEERMKSMVLERADWCISRQRVWGVPIPIFYCAGCGEALITEASVAAVADLFRKEGSDGWWRHEAAEILPADTRCPHCGGEVFTKESDIMDVWFDSGSSHVAVCEERGMGWPADLYLEGSDQYRGWFQSSLLISVGARGRAPYRGVLCHGMVLDGEGHKMSKSLGNGLLPEEIVGQYGADILRLWVASADFTADIHISKEILSQVSDGYRKIRNTARFILGCLSDFDPDAHALSERSLEPLDRYEMQRLQVLVSEVRDAYDAYAYHVVYHAIHRFCVVELSNFYLDVLKDRLYVERAHSHTRRAAQTALHRILETITLLIAPILAFTADEIWDSQRHGAAYAGKPIQLCRMPEPDASPVDDALFARFERIAAVRLEVNKALEEKRASKELGSSLEAHVTLTAGGETYRALCEDKDILQQCLIVSELSIRDGAPPEGAICGVEISAAAGAKCERCWMYSGTVGESAEHPALCRRCADIILHP